MTKLITISHNELRALFKRVFESYYNHNHDFDEMAHCALWLVAHGYEGVACVLAERDFCQNNIPILSSLTPQENKYSFVCHSLPLFRCLYSFTDFACAQVHSNNVVQFTLRDMKFKHQFLPTIIYAHAHNYAAAYIWREGENLRIALIDEKENYLTIRGGKTPLLGCTDKESVLICARTPCALKEKISALGVDVDILPVLQSAQSLKEHYHSSLMNGIQITYIDYDVLQDIGNAILVPDCAISRRGAGE